MKTHCRGHVNILVSVVHHMHMPEYRDKVEHPMLKVDNEIKHQYADEQRQWLYYMAVIQ